MSDPANLTPLVWDRIERRIKANIKAGQLFVQPTEPPDVKGVWIMTDPNTGAPLNIYSNDGVDQ